MATTALNQSSPIVETVKSHIDSGANLQPDQPAQDTASTQNGVVQDPTKLAFQIIDTCTYTPKYLGSSDQEALGCDCGEEWGTVLFFIHSPKTN